MPKTGPPHVCSTLTKAMDCGSVRDSKSIPAPGAARLVDPVSCDVHEAGCRDKMPGRRSVLLLRLRVACRGDR